MLHTDLNNSCAENVVVQGMAHLMKRRIEFRYPKVVNPDQVVLHSVLHQIESEGSYHPVLDSEDAIDGLLDYLNQDRTKIHLMYQGKVGYAGHYSLLYFSERYESWIAYSSHKNHFNLSNRQEAVEALVRRNDTWGTRQSEYFISIDELNENRLIGMANFIYDVRTSSEETADNNLYATNQPSLNKNLVLTELLNPEDADPNLPVPIHKKTPALTQEEARRLLSFSDEPQLKLGQGFALSYTQRAIASGILTFALAATSYYISSTFLIAIAACMFVYATHQTYHAMRGPGLSF